MPSPWVWEEASKRYRDTRSGRYIGKKQMLTLRDAFTDAMKTEARRITDALPTGQQALGPWLGQMRDLIKRAYIDQYALARGGRNALTKADWGKIGSIVKGQYNHLQVMAADMAAGKLTGPQMAARAAQYMDSSTQAFERGKAASYGSPSLPAYPGDSNQQCGARCRCSWSIDERADAFDCYWTLGQSDHCGDCLSHAAEWNPLVIQK